MSNVVADYLLAVGLLVMMYPILCKVKFETLHHLLAHRQIWRQIGFSLFMNWVVAPLLMVILHILLVVASFSLMWNVAGSYVGFSSGQTCSAGWIDTRWISPMYCYG